MATIYEAAKDTAKKIRDALKEAFPQLPKTHFRVRADGYDKVQVDWVDFPTTDAVEQVLNRFKGGRYDMHEDLHTNEGYMQDGKRVVGAQYLFARINYSPERTAKIKEIMSFVFGDIDHNTQYRYFNEIAKGFNEDGEYVGAHLQNYLHNKGLVAINDTEKLVENRLDTLESYFQALAQRTALNIDRFEPFVTNAIARLPQDWGVTYVSTPTHFIASIQDTPWLVIHPMYITNVQNGYDIYTHPVVNEITTAGTQGKIDVQLSDWYQMMLAAPFVKIHRDTETFNRAVMLKSTDVIERSERLAALLAKLPEQNLIQHNVKLIKVSRVGTLTEVRFLVPTKYGYNRYLAITPLTIRWADTSEILYASTEYSLPDFLQQLGSVVQFADIAALRLIKLSVQKAYDKRYALAE